MTEKAGKPVGSRERKRLKDEVLTDLLPRAFTRLSKRNAYLDTENGWLVVDTASRKAAESRVSLIREALGSFPAAPLAPDESPRVLMTDWLAHGKLPPGLALGDECELRDSGDGGAAVRCRRQDLESDEIREHLKSGKQVFPARPGVRRTAEFQPRRRSRRAQAALSRSGAGRTWATRRRSRPSPNSMHGLR